jgi:hypothetical protein
MCQEYSKITPIALDNATCYYINTHLYIDIELEEDRKWKLE